MQLTFSGTVSLQTVPESFQGYSKFNNYGPQKIGDIVIS